MWSNGQELASQWIAGCFFLGITAVFLAGSGNDKNPCGVLCWVCIIGLLLSPAIPMMVLGKEADKPYQPVIRRLSDLKLCPILPDGSIGEPRD